MPPSKIHEIVFVVWSGNGSNKYSEEDLCLQRPLPTDLSKQMFGSITIKYWTSHDRKEMKEIQIYDDLLVLSSNLCFRPLIELKDMTKPFKVGCYSQPGILEIIPTTEDHLKFSFTRSNENLNFETNRSDLFRNLFGCGVRILECVQLMLDQFGNREGMQPMYDYVRQMYEKALSSDTIDVVPYFIELFETNKTSIGL